MLFLGIWFCAQMDTVLDFFRWHFSEESLSKAAMEWCYECMRWNGVMTFCRSLGSSDILGCGCGFGYDCDI
jgi:hypothetical protein